MSRSSVARSIGDGVAVVTIVVAVVVTAGLWSDGGASLLLLAGVPVLASALVLAARHGRARVVALWVAAVVVCAWSLLTVVGTGMYFLPFGVLLLLAAVVTTTSVPSEGAPAVPTSSS